eukprot:scaffold21282_cov57-Phaeocystis_antarctica.AAC.3
MTWVPAPAARAADGPRRARAWGGLGHALALVRPEFRPDLGWPCSRQRRWPEDVDREEVVPLLGVDDQPVEELGDVGQRVAQRGGGPKARGRRVAAAECEQGGVHTWRDKGGVHTWRAEACRGGGGGDGASAFGGECGGGRAARGKAGGGGGVRNEGGVFTPGVQRMQQSSPARSSCSPSAGAPACP